jgi:hypothetical protein
MISVVSCGMYPLRVNRHSMCREFSNTTSNRITLILFQYPLRVNIFLRENYNRHYKMNKGFYCCIDFPNKLDLK